MLQIYDLRLVALSILVAMGAAYTALSLAERFRHSPDNRLSWLAGGALAMGIGIWSMHFIGMLALTLPIPLAYAPGRTALSLLAAVSISGLAMILINAPTLSWRRLLGGTLAMGTGICVMHYLGMSAVEVSPGIRYDPWLFAASVAIAMGASLAALLIVHRLTQMRHRGLRSARVGAAIVMGLAIAGMHYTGMAAAHFADDAICTAPGGANQTWMAVSLGVGALGLLAIAVIASLFDAHMASRTQALNSSLRAANLELARQATHDALTDLPNRTLLADRIDRALADASRTGEMFAVLFIDLDRFKSINDSLGHHVGDQLLRQTSTRMAARIGPRDTLARLGGDEFVILLRGLTGPKDAARFARSLRQSITEPIKVGSRSVHMAATIGISLYPGDGSDAESLIVNADAAMYHGKQAGRDAYHYFSAGMNEFAQKRFEIENGLREAIAGEALELHYQPKVRIATAEVVSVEALVRWRHPDRGLIPPDEFIPVAEETGLIVELGEWVLREACRQNKAWQRAGIRPVRIAVNLSPKQFRQKDLLDMVHAVLADTGLEPCFLELELTEGTVMSEPENSIRILTELTRMGVQIAIDDFGTGYSSLAYLKRLPLHTLKVDREFIRELADNPDDAAIVNAVISMAHSLRLEVVAEGVETAEQLALLQSLNCDQLQGYYFSPPVNAEAATHFLRLTAPNPTVDARSGPSAGSTDVTTSAVNAVLSPYARPAPRTDDGQPARA